MSNIKGNFGFAVQQLLGRLNRAKTTPGLARFVDDILTEWDYNRGNDWHSSTLLSDEIAERNEFLRLKDIYEREDN